MGLLARLAILFILVPLLELALLIQLGRVVGLWPTIALVALTGLAGAALARAQGIRVVWGFQAEMAAGRMPTEPLMDGLAVLVGGALLLTPGLLTDAVGFALLLPPTRRWLKGRVRRALERSIAEGSVRVGVFTTARFPDDTDPRPPGAH